MAAVASSSSTRPSLPQLPDGEGNETPNWVLLDILGYISECPNATFAESSTSSGHRIEVSFYIAPPPNVSHFCVHCPGVKPSEYFMAPKVISAEANLILFCLSVIPCVYFNPRYRDYFLYRAHPRNPSLDLVPHPYPNSFRDHEVALLSFDGDEYAIAALTGRCDTVAFDEDDTLNDKEFDLHLYRSSKAREGWTSKLLSVAHPRRDSVCPVDRGLYHETTKVIILGRGRLAMVGWVDLWRGILVCSVLEENPVLHDILLPPPARGNWALYHKCRPYIIRDVTVSLLKDSIKYIEMEVCPPVVAPGDPPASYANWFRQKPREWQCRKPCVSWRATTWILSTSNLTSAKWNINCTFDIADVTVDTMHSKLLPRPSSIKDNPSGASLLQCLVIGFPTMSMDEDAVYMLSKGCPSGPMEVVIAIDMKKKKVQGVGKLVTGKDFTYTRNCTSEVSKYLSEDKAQVKLDEQT